MHSRLTEHAEAYVAAVAARLAAAGVSARPVVCHGPAAEAIVEYAERAGVGQIVMATHGYTGVRRWSHGSVAERRAVFERNRAR